MAKKEKRVKRNTGAGTHHGAIAAHSNAESASFLGIITGEPGVARGRHPFRAGRGGKQFSRYPRANG